jgi:hypothetical protein
VYNNQRNIFFHDNSLFLTHPILTYVCRVAFDEATKVWVVEEPNDDDPEGRHQHNHEPVGPAPGVVIALLLDSIAVFADLPCPPLC